MRLKSLDSEILVDLVQRYLVVIGWRAVGMRAVEIRLGQTWSLDRAVR